MATVYVAKNGARTWAKILKSLLISAVGSTGHIKRRMWWCLATGTPAVTAGSYAEIPLEIGDFIYQSYDDDVYTVTIAPAASTAATVVKITP